MRGAVSVALAYNQVKFWKASIQWIKYTNIENDVCYFFFLSGVYDSSSLSVIFLLKPST